MRLPGAKTLEGGEGDRVRALWLQGLRQWRLIWFCSVLWDYVIVDREAILFMDFFVECEAILV